MKEEKAMLENIYEQAVQVSRQTHQTVGEKKDYYITLYQLEVILKQFTE